MDIERLRKILEMDPEDPLANFGVGRKLVMESRVRADHEEAVPYLRKAVAGDPHHLAASYALALALQTTGDQAGARAACEAALTILPQVPEGGGQDLEPAFRELMDELD